MLQIEEAPLFSIASDNQVHPQEGHAVIETQNIPAADAWKTYRSEEYGIEIKYPEYMTVSGPTGTRHGPDGTTIDEGLSLGIYDKKYQKDVERVEGEIPQLVIDGLFWDPEKEQSTVFKKDNLSYMGEYPYLIETHFQLNCLNIRSKCIILGKEIDEMIDLCNQIISTFKCTKTE